MSSRLYSILIIWIFSVLSIKCFGFNYDLPVAQDEFKVMTYNVLNLFDTVHAPGKVDFEFLPVANPEKAPGCRQIRQEWRRLKCLRTDWTEQKLRIKLQQIKRAIDAQGELPELLGVQEIESPEVAQRLAETLGYRHFKITQSADMRNVNVALFYRQDKLRFVSYKEIQVDPERLFPTRNILRVDFAIRTKTQRASVLSIYVNHWPSQTAPSGARFALANILRRDLVDHIKRRGLRHHVVVLGDFNTTAHEVPNSLSQNILYPLPPFAFSDTQELLARGRRFPDSMPPASYFFSNEGTWNQLDHIMISPNLIKDSRISVIRESFRIVAPSFLTYTYEMRNKASHLYGSVFNGIPLGYDFDTTNITQAGFSDHFPVVVKFKIND